MFLAYMLHMYAIRLHPTAAYSTSQVWEPDALNQPSPSSQSKKEAGTWGMGGGVTGWCHIQRERDFASLATQGPYLLRPVLRTG